jgi:L-seryl-tRNA(Ser) seleniumtransferase
VDLNQFGIHDEPTVQDSLRAGVDVVSISGDKLLGGPQAGIILGKKKYVDILKKHPLTRAMRVDKMTLAALEATLRSYEAEKAMEEVPTIAMLAVSQEALLVKAERLCQALTDAGCNAQVASTQGQVGGGSVPTKMLESFAVALEPKQGSVDAMEEKLRLGEPPIIGRIHHDRYLLDVRTLKETDFEEIVKAAVEAGA